MVSSIEAIEVGAALPNSSRSNSLEALLEGVSAGVGGRASLNLLFCGVVTASSVSLDRFLDCVVFTVPSSSFCVVAVVFLVGDDNVSMMAESNILRFFAFWSTFWLLVTRPKVLIVFWLATVFDSGLAALRFLVTGMIWNMI